MINEEEIREIVYKKLKKHCRVVCQERFGRIRFYNVLKNELRALPAKNILDDKKLFKRFLDFDQEAIKNIVDFDPEYKTGVVPEAPKKRRGRPKKKK